MSKARKKPPCLPVYLPEPVKEKYGRLCDNAGERSMSARVLRLIHQDIKANPDLWSTAAAAAAPA